MQMKKKKKRDSHSFLVQLLKTRSKKRQRRRKRKKHIYISVDSLLEKSHGQYNNEVLARIFPGYRHVYAPKVFSLVDNRDEVLGFLHDLRTCQEKRKKTLVRMDNVETLPTDAILVLLSIMVQFKTSKVDFNGTKPKDEECGLKLVASGFFEYLYKKNYSPRDKYSFRKMKSFLYTHGQKTVASELADQLVKYASETVWGEARRCQGIQKTLLELMHNTYDHAGLTKGDKHWWLSVEHDEENHEVTFSFIDFGVGIFRSLANKGPNEPLYGAWQRILQSFPLATTQVEKLKLILEGTVQLTQYNEYYRGKGLAKIYKHFTSNRIASLCIISNFAYIDAEKQVFVTLSKEFIGTFISFKIKQNIISLPWQI